MLCGQNRREYYYIIEKVAKTFEVIIIVYLSLRVDLKQSFINLAFDRKIYLFNEGVRTAFLNPLFFYNSNKINNLEVLKIEKVGIKMPTFPSGGAEGSRTPVQTRSS